MIPVYSFYCEMCCLWHCLFRGFTPVVIDGIIICPQAWGSCLLLCLIPQPDSSILLSCSVSPLECIKRSGCWLRLPHVCPHVLDHLASLYFTPYIYADWLWFYVFHLGCICSLCWHNHESRTSAIISCSHHTHHWCYFLAILDLHISLCAKWHLLLLFQGHEDMVVEDGGSADHVSIRPQSIASLSWKPACQVVISCLHGSDPRKRLSFPYSGDLPLAQLSLVILFAVIKPCAALSPHQQELLL